MKQEKKFMKEFYKSNLSFSKIQTFKNINFWHSHFAFLVKINCLRLNIKSWIGRTYRKAIWYRSENLAFLKLAFFKVFIKVLMFWYTEGKGGYFGRTHHDCFLEKWSETFCLKALQHSVTFLPLNQWQEYIWQFADLLIPFWKNLSLMTIQTQVEITAYCTTISRFDYAYLAPIT